MMYTDLIRFFFLPSGQLFTTEVQYVLAHLKKQKDIKLYK